MLCYHSSYLESYSGYEYQLLRNKATELKAGKGSHEKALKRSYAYDQFQRVMFLFPCCIQHLQPKHIPQNNSQNQSMGCVILLLQVLVFYMDLCPRACVIIKYYTFVTYLCYYLSAFTFKMGGSKY